MSGISTTLQLVDRMTAPIMSIDNAINGLINGFSGVANAADIDTASFDNIKHQVEMAGFAAEQLNQTFSIVDDSINQMSSAQSGFNNHLQQSNGLADGLTGKIKSAVAAAAGFLTIKSATGFIQDSINLTNQRIQAEQQLANVLANQGASEADYLALKEEAAAIKDNSMYSSSAMLGAAGELATYIKDADALKSMMGTVANYAAGMSGGMEVSYQQMVDYATQLGKALDGTYDGLKKKGFELTEVQKAVIDAGSFDELIQQGVQLSAEYEQLAKDNYELMKAMVIDDVINQSWAGLAEQMAQTPEGMRVSMINSINEIREGFGAQLLPVLMTVFETIQANLPQIQQMIQAIVPVIQFIITLIGNIVQVAFSVYQFFSDNWSLIGPIIYGIAAAIAVWKAITIVMTVVQWAMNAALTANPIGVIIMAIAAIVGAIVLWANKVGGFRVLWLIVVNAILTAWDWVKIAFFTGIYWVLDLWDKMKLGMMTAGTAIANFMGDMKAAILMILQNMVNGAINIINGFIKVLNFIPGVNIGLIEQVTFGTQAQLENEAAKQAREDNLNAYRDEINAGIAGRDAALSQMRDDARSATADRLAEIDAARAAANQEEETALTTPDDFVATNFDGAGSSQMSDQLGGQMGDIGANTAAIAGNTKATADFSEESIKLWRDIAEQETINRFTTAEVNIDFGGINNNVSSEMDLDGIIDYIADGLEEALLVTVEGVHV